MEIVMKKMADGFLAPSSEDDADLLRKIKTGVGVKVKVTRIRSCPFLQKYMVMINFLFDLWTETAPRIRHKGEEIQPNKERFRKDLQILAGFYDVVFNVRGELRYESKSVSFDGMEEEEFEKLFSCVINAALAKILNRPEWSEAKVRAACDALMHFDR